MREARETTLIPLVRTATEKNPGTGHLMRCGQIVADLFRTYVDYVAHSVLCVPACTILIQLPLPLRGCSKWRHRWRRPQHRALPNDENKYARGNEWRACNLFHISSKYLDRCSYVYSGEFRQRQMRICRRNLAATPISAYIKDTKR